MWIPERGLGDADGIPGDTGGISVTHYVMFLFSQIEGLVGQLPDHMKKFKPNPKCAFTVSFCNVHESTYGRSLS